MPECLDNAEQSCRSGTRDGTGSSKHSSGSAVVLTKLACDRDVREVTQPEDGNVVHMKPGLGGGRLTGSRKAPAVDQWP
jgi:hypothetical protein